MYMVLLPYHVREELPVRVDDGSASVVCRTLEREYLEVGRYRISYGRRG